MKKEWKNYGQFRRLEPTNDEAMAYIEEKLDATRDNWQGGHGNREPLEKAIPLEDCFQDVNKIP